MHKVIGITTMTESSAVYTSDGVVKHAIEEERIVRLKHYGGIPYNSIDYILMKENLELKDIDTLAVYWDPYKLPQRLIIFLYNILTNIKSAKNKIFRALSVMQGVEYPDSGWKDLFLIKSKLKKRYGCLPKKIQFHDHHLCHVASAYYPSGFKDSSILVMDGAGEISATTIATGISNQIELKEKINLPHSLGHFYSSFTGFLGFKMLDGEYKVMGLAPYGKPKYSEWLKKNILIPLNEGFYRLNIRNLDYHDALQNKFSKVVLNKFGEQNDDTYKKIDQKYLDLASSIQNVFEEVVVDISKYIKNKYDLKNLCIVGGCGLNCKANGAILEKKIFDNIFIPPVPNDPGGALGAAYLSSPKQIGNKSNKFESAYLGYEITNPKIEKCINKFSLKARKVDEEELINEAVKDLIKGEVIAWIHGKMEFGPRALGNRSFLADPRKEEIIEKINVKIKKREKFRPFAPSVLEEYKNIFFDLSQESNFMSFIVNVKKEMRDLVPAIVHYDGSARPQTVKKETNPLYWKLINSFYKKTNIPMLLNTSYNIDEPIACTEDDCFNTFINSGIEKMFIGDYIVTK